MSIDGTSGNDSLDGTIGGDVINGFAGDDTINGLAGDDTIFGGAGADSLSGGSGNDSITADGAESIIFGDSGNDTIFGSDSGATGPTFDSFIFPSFRSEQIRPGAGADVITTRAGYDFIIGSMFELAGDRITDFSPGDVILIAGPGLLITSDVAFDSASGQILLEIDNFPGFDSAITLDGDFSDLTFIVEQEASSGNLFVYFLPTNAMTLTGGVSDDALVGGLLGDSITGDAGVDAIDGNAGDDIIRGGAGADRILGGDGDDLIYGGVAAGESNEAGDEFLNGGNGDDTIYSASSHDPMGSAPTYYIHAGAGDDLVLGAAGAEVIVDIGGSDRLDGGFGADMLLIGDSSEQSSQIVILNDARVATNSVDQDTITGFETVQIYGGFDDDTIVAQSYFDTIADVPGGAIVTQVFLSSGHGDNFLQIGDVVSGYASADGSGNDTLIGGAENSTFSFSGGGADFLSTGDGADTVRILPIDALGSPLTAPVTITDFSDEDVILIPTFFILTNPNLSVSVNGNVTTLQVDFDQYGSPDIIVNLLGVYSGSFQFFESAQGGEMEIHYIGAVDQHGFAGGYFADLVVGGAGDDWLFGFDNDDTLVGGGGADSLDGGKGNDFLRGFNGNDRLFAGLGHDRADGGLGDDFVRTSNGRDTALGGDGNDTLGAGSGGDLMNGGLGTDLLLASNGDDRLYGGDGDDTMLGGGGRDTLTGGAGNDRLVGGSENDGFNFSPGSGADLIVDFEEGAASGDVIRLIGFGAAFDDFADVLAASTQVGANVVIDLGGGDSITLQGVTLGSLNAGDFAFG